MLENCVPIRVAIRKHVAVNTNRFVVTKKKQAASDRSTPSGYIRASNFLIAFPSDIFMVGYFGGSVGSSGCTLLSFTR